MTQSVTTRDLASHIDDAAGLMAYAEDKFNSLAVLTDAIHALVEEPEIGRGLAMIAHEIASELADSFGGFKRKYNSEIQRIHNAEQSSRGNA